MQWVMGMHDETASLFECLQRTPFHCHPAAFPMNIIVNEELKAYIDPLTPEEYEALERSIKAEGWRDALVLWNDLLIDGHNRYAICQAHGLPFQTLQSTQFKTIEDVHLWMIDQHLGRCCVSDFQRGVLALRNRQIEAERRTRTQASPSQDAANPDTNATPEAPPWDDTTPSGTQNTSQALTSREDMAKAARLSNGQMVMIEKIQKQATPERVAAVKAGVISINAGAAVSSLPAQEQVAAAAAGKDELKQAAKRVRDAKCAQCASPNPPIESQDDFMNFSTRFASADRPALRNLFFDWLEG